MALIVLTSASGSPGATTTAVGFALAWPRPVVLVEADPTGGSPILAGYFRGTVAPGRGLIDLALAHRDGHVAAALPGTLMPIPASQVPSPVPVPVPVPARERGAWLLPGIRGHAQARSLTPVWEPLADAFTAPVHGFQGADDYYQRSSSLHFLDSIRVPTLLLSAVDDPFLPPVVLDRVRETAASNPALHVEFTAAGGHVGWVMGPPWAPTYYMESRLMHWFDGIER